VFCLAENNADQRLLRAVASFAIDDWLHSSRVPSTLPLNRFPELWVRQGLFESFDSGRAPRHFLGKKEIPFAARGATGND